MKNQAKTIALLLLAAILANGCQREDPSADFGQQDNGKGTLPFVSKRKTFGELNQDPRFANAYGKISAKGSEAVGSSAKTVMEDRYGFTIDPSLVKEVTYGSYVSYTFFIRRDVPEDGVFENLIVDADSLDGVRAFIARHTLNAPIGYVEEHGAYTLDSEVELLPIEYDIGQAKLVYSCTQSYELRCNGRGNGACNASPHLVGPECYEFSPLCIYLSPTTSCGFEDVPDEGGGGGGSSPPNPGPGNGPPPHPGGNGSGNSNGNNNNLPVINDPVVEGETQNPCDKLVQYEQDSYIKGQLNGFKAIAEDDNVKVEVGAVFKKNGTGWGAVPVIGTPENPHITFSFQPGATIDVFVHTHFKGLMSTFSPGDLQMYHQVLSGNVSANGTDLIFILVTNSGTKYAFKVTDLDKFDAIAQEHFQTTDDLNAFSIDYFDNIDIENDNNTNELEFLKMMKKLNLGISLFSANGDFSQWKELALNEAEDDVIENDCN